MLHYNSRNGLEVLSLVVPMPSGPHVVLTLSPHCPCHPHISMLSPHCPHHHHIVYMVPHGLHVISMDPCVVPTLSLPSRCCSHHEPSINTSIYPPIVGGVSINHKSSYRIELSQLSQDLSDIFSNSTWVQPLTHPLTHPSTQPSINPPIDGGVSTNHKSSHRTELSQLGQNLFDI